MRCIFHKDDSPSLSLNVETGKFRCFAPHCPAHRGGGYKHFDDLLKGNIPGVLAHNDPIHESVVEGYHAILLADNSRLKWLHDKRGLTQATIVEYRLGWDSDRFIIPVRAKGEIVNLRKYKPEARNDKVVNHGSGHGRPRLFPEVNPDGDVLLFEGEMDTLLARQCGYRASTVTSGAGQWHSEISNELKGRDVYIIYDMDKAGVQGAARIGQLLIDVAKTVRIVKLPLPGTKELKDFTNMFHDRGAPLEQSRAEFQKALDEATLVEAHVQERKAPDSTVTPIHLSQIGLDTYVHKRVKSTVLIAGKDLAPFQVPKCISFSCIGGEKICGGCGIHQAGLNLDKTFEEWEPQLLEMVNVPIEKLDSILAQVAGVPFRCRKFKHQIKEHANIEAVKAIPEIDFTAEKSEYVIRNLFYLGHSLVTNTTYNISATVMPDPKTQYATALIYHAEPTKNTIDKFEMTEGLLEQLAIFKIDPD